MAAVAKWYTKAFMNMLGGESASETKSIDFLSDSIKVMLLADTYTLSQHTHEVKADVVAHEITGQGYTAGGTTLTSKALNRENGEVRLDGDDLEWLNAVITARYAIFYDDTSEDDLLLGYIDFDVNKSVDNGPFTIELHEDGFLKITVA